MICDAFEQLVTDTQDEQTFAEASARHVAACPGCAARVAAEARVTQALRALADADRHREAPAHVEVMARAVWRGTAVARATAMATPAPPTLAMNWWRPAAAAAFTVVPLILGMWLRPTGRASEARDVRPMPPIEASVPKLPAVTRVPTAPAARASTRMPARAARRTSSSASRTHGSAPAPAASRSPSPADTLAFVPFPYAEPLRPTEVRQIVRVAVPQATLLMAGLTTATPADSVVADVLVGEDGIARGIRIVR